VTRKVDAKKGTEPGQVRDRQPMVPGDGPIRPAVADARGAAIPATDDAGRGLPAMPRTGGLLMPVADVDALVESFKMYVLLKDRLLEDGDYMWHVVWSLGDKQGRKVLDGGEVAKAFARDLEASGMSGVKLEKKIKKSGCLKLSKAFGISTAILDMYEDRTAGTAVYKMRAVAPNGQYRDRTGSCDRDEKGRRDRPYDTISATALTRAENRAILALVGGENTSEEFEEDGADAPPKPQEIVTGAVGPPMTHGEALAEIDKKFVQGDVKPAAALDDRTISMRGFWAKLRELYPSQSAAKDAAHAVLLKLYKKESFTEATTDEIDALKVRVENALHARASKVEGK
jgi:hypothetical protein